jgi:hypothetical protein
MDRRIGSFWHQLSAGRRLLLALALLAHLSLLISWRAGWFHGLTFDSVATHGRRGWDFYAVYQAGHNALTGASIYESDNERIDVVVPRYTPYRYLPFTALTLGVAVNALTPLWALRLWVLAIELTLLACVASTWRLAREPNQAALLASMWLLCTPFYLEIYLGQFTLVQAALVWALLLSSQYGLNRRSDVWWTLSLLWKQNSALLAPLYLKERRWLPLLGVGAVVLLLSLPYWLAVPGSLADFAGNLDAGQPGHQLGNLGVRQWLYSVTTWLAPRLSAAGHVWLARGWVLAVLAVGALATWRAPQNAVGALVCLWMSAFFLVYHHVWEHHYVLAMPICVWLYDRYRSRWVLACWALLAIWTPYGLIDPTGLAAWHAPMRWMPLEPRWLDVLYHSSKAAPVLALWAWQVCRLLRTRKPCSPDCATI